MTPAILLMALQALASPPDLTGTWGMVQVAVSAARVPVFGEVKTAMNTWSLLQIRKEGDGWIQRQEICGFQMQGRSLLARTTVPPGYARTLPVRERPLRIWEEAGAWSYAVDLGNLPVGYDPSRGDIPSSLQDPSVADTDRDGHPGATVQLTVALFGTADLFVAQKADVVLTGRILDPDRVEGTMLVRSVEQRVLDASNRLFIVNPRIRPVPGESHFRIQRLPEGSGCQDGRPGGLDLE